MKKLYFLCLALLLAVFNGFAQTATEPDGTGTSSDPYKIASLNNLYWMSQNTQYGKYYIQTDDIDASDTKDWDSGKGFLPISSFSGSYDGQGYIISNLYINRPSKGNVGLFSILYPQSRSTKISNINLVNCDFSGGSYTGAIAGYANRASATASGSKIYTVTISNCRATGTISGGQYTGGVVGYAVTATLSECYFSGNLYAKLIGGGIAGVIHNESTLSECFSSGTVEESTGNSGTDMYVGGLVGECCDTSIIVNCYSMSSVSAGRYMGGLVGDISYSTMSYCYFAGMLSGSYCGSLAGRNDNGEVTYCYWDKTLSGTTAVWKTLSGTNESLTGLSSVEMRYYDNLTNLSLFDIWNIYEGKTYPALLSMSNNSPSTIDDTIDVSLSGILTSKFLANAFDYEAFQCNL